MHCAICDRVGYVPGRLRVLLTTTAFYALGRGSEEERKVEVAAGAPVCRWHDAWSARVDAVRAAAAEGNPHAIAWLVRWDLRPQKQGG